MNYLCLIYIDDEQVAATPQDEMDTLLAETNVYNDMLREKGHLVSAAGLKPVQAAVTLRLRQGKLSTTDGSFAETKEVLGGFYVIEARDLNEAIQLAAQSSSLRIGSVEVRPVDDLI